jgi:cell division protease FtsH
MSDRAREEVRKLVSEALEKARRIVKRERATLEQIAELLLEQETVSRDELALLVGHRNELEKP